MALGGENSRPIFINPHIQIIRMTYVTSSNLRAVDYDALTATLTIVFHNGRRYQYHGVPENMYQQLLCAASKGRYFSAFIRNHFPTIRIA